ncbi:Os05g0562601 [Oryza sativa Japonica Group]|uniref:Os05g0562601 protein n=1 Tax=Oryza sativa subsp. japonica TaxID=39947 RepID=A0A0P0WR44_ORYSJ|nr:Os05g0562601 [Oryza sativa Japonica Group]
MSSAPVVAAMTRAFFLATRPLASTNAALAAQQIVNVAAAAGADDNCGLALLLAIASRRGRCIYEQNKRISSLMEQRIAF